MKTATPLYKVSSLSVLKECPQWYWTRFRRYISSTSRRKLADIQPSSGNTSITFKEYNPQFTNFFSKLKDGRGNHSKRVLYVWQELLLSNREQRIKELK